MDMRDVMKGSPEGIRLLCAIFHDKKTIFRNFRLCRKCKAQIKAVSAKEGQGDE